MATIMIPPGARPVITFFAAVTAVAGVPVTIAAFAQANPLDAPRCAIVRETLTSDEQAFVADVRTCRTQGVEVSRSVTPIVEG